MAEGKARKKGKKNRKHNRNKVKCEKYRAKNMRMKNKIRKIRKHIKDHPNDLNSKETMAGLV